MQKIFFVIFLCCSGIIYCSQPKAAPAASAGAHQSQESLQKLQESQAIVRLQTEKAAQQQEIVHLKAQLQLYSNGYHDKHKAVEQMKRCGEAVQASHELKSKQLIALLVKQREQEESLLAQLKAARAHAQKVEAESVAERMRFLAKRDEMLTREEQLKKAALKEAELKKAMKKLIETLSADIRALKLKTETPQATTKT